MTVFGKALRLGCPLHALTLLATLEQFALHSPRVEVFVHAELQLNAHVLARRGLVLLLRGQIGDV